jgi:hypothetical protein
MTDNHPRMCGFIRTADENIHAVSGRINLGVQLFDGTMILPKEDNKAKTEEEAKKLMYRCSAKTNTRWCITYKSGTRTGIYHVLPNPGDKRNIGMYHSDYEPRTKKDGDGHEHWSTYRLA